MKRIQAAMAAKAAARGEPLDQKHKGDILNLKAEVKAEAGEHCACSSCGAPNRRVLLNCDVQTASQGGQFLMHCSCRQSQ